MYAISRVYREEDVPQEQPVITQKRAPLPPSAHVYLRPVPPTPRRAPQQFVQGKHHPMCMCDACQPTFVQQTYPVRPRQAAQSPSSSTRTQRYEPVAAPLPRAGAEQDLRTVLVPTILQRLRASIEAHPLIWLGVSYVLHLF